MKTKLTHHLLAALLDVAFMDQPRLVTKDSGEIGI